MGRVIVDVTLKSEILDPQGQAVLRALQSQGLKQVADVRQGKTFEITFEGAINKEVLDQVEALASVVLSNPVIENFVLRSYEKES